MTEELQWPVPRHQYSGTCGCYPTNSKRARSFVIPIDKLKPFYGDPPPSWLPDSATTEDDTMRYPAVELPTQGETPTPSPDQPVSGPALDPGSPESNDPDLVEPSACSSAQQQDMESNHEISDTETKIRVVDDDHSIVTRNTEVEPEIILTSVESETVVQQKPFRARPPAALRDFVRKIQVEYRCSTLGMPDILANISDYIRSRRARIRSAQ